jgi:hypothetical protein
MAALNGIAAEFSARFYGGRFESLQRDVTAGVAAANIVQNNPERAALLIINLSVNTVVIRPGGGATLTSGIVLAPSGGSFSTVLLNDLVLPSYSYDAIASAAASELFIVEVNRYARTDNGGNANGS